MSVNAGPACLHFHVAAVDVAAVDVAAVDVDGVVSDAREVNERTTMLLAWTSKTRPPPPVSWVA